MFENLKVLRKSNHKTQSDFGDEFGIAQTTYAGYEQGKSDPPSSFLYAVAEKYQVSIDWLMGLSDDPHKTAFEGPSELERKYSALDETGRKLVDAVLDIEAERFKEPLVLENERKKIIPLFAAAAGPSGDMVDGAAYEEYKVDEDSKAVFAVRISGDSMEPEFSDGDVVLCDARVPKIGEIGVLLVNGFLLVKQYIEDSFGNIYLRSLNRERSDLDVDVLASGNDTVVGWGTVMHKRVPLVDN